MVMMASSRDLVSIFVALEFLSIPAYMLAAWRKRDNKSNEAGVKYFLLGVFASASVMLYGMSFAVRRDRHDRPRRYQRQLCEQMVIRRLRRAGDRVRFLIGFAFKISAVPFHQWAPDTYQRRPDTHHGVPVGRGRKRRGSSPS